jgi:hypothetical protein
LLTLRSNNWHKRYVIVQDDVALTPMDVARMHAETMEHRGEAKALEYVYSINECASVQKL